jgi:hypothetical protein
MRRALISLAAVGALVIPATAQADESMHGCVVPRVFPEPTLSVRGMECRAGIKVVHNLFDENPNADGLDFKTTGHFLTTGRTGRLPDRRRRFRCAVRYDSGTGLNRYGILMTVRCRVGHRIAFVYTEQQDNA